MNFRKTITFILILATIQGWSQALTNKQVNDSIISILKETDTPNAFVRVVSKDSTLFQSEYGYIDDDKETHLNKEGLFAIGSISKTFTALAIMKLVNEGKLNLNDKLKDIAPEIEFYNEWARTHPIKLKHLLTHRSGFDDMHISALIKKRNTEFTTLEEVLAYNKSYQSHWKPGLVFSYSNPGYIILGYIIEKISGVPYQEYITNNILLPLKMNNTTYYSLTKTKKLTTGYQKYNGKIEQSDIPKIIGESAGGMYSNGDDMSKLLQFFLDEKKQHTSDIISPELAREMEKLQSNFEKSNNILTGYSIGMYDFLYGSENINFKKHNGSINGFSSDYLYNKELNIGITVSRNLFAKSNKDIINLLVNNFTNTSKIEKDDSNQVSIDISKFKEWEGTYKLLNNTNNLVDFLNAPLRTMQINIINDSLYAKRFMGDDEVYYNIKDNIFNEVNEDFPTLFLSTMDNEKTLVLSEDTLIKINPIKYYAILSILILSLLAGIVISFISIIQVIILPFKKSIIHSLKTSLMIGLPFWLILTSLILYLLNSSFLDLKNLGNITIISVSIFLCTLFYPIITSYVGYKLFKKQLYFEANRFNIVYTILFFGVTSFSLYCLSYGWFALRLWDY